MKYVSYIREEKKEFGILENNKIYTIKNVASLLSWIQLENRVLSKDIIREEYVALEDVKITAPIEEPIRNLICLGKNYVDHANELQKVEGVNSEVPNYPIYFGKMVDPIIGQDDVIMSHSHLTNAIDYEVELAIIIGKTCEQVAKEHAKDYIFGFTVANDVSARDIQIRHEQWLMGKSLKTFCSMGPVIVSTDEFTFPLELSITCKVNNELRQSSNTSNMIFDVETIVSELSQMIVLKPGDIILTGTPSGVGMGYEPPKYLVSGDTVSCFIDRIGVLRNTIK